VGETSSAQADGRQYAREARFARVRGAAMAGRMAQSLGMPIP